MYRPRLLELWPGEAVPSPTVPPRGYFKTAERLNRQRSGGVTKAGATGLEPAISGVTGPRLRVLPGTNGNVERPIDALAAAFVGRPTRGHSGVLANLLPTVGALDAIRALEARRSSPAECAGRAFEGPDDLARDPAAVEVARLRFDDLAVE